MRYQLSERVEPDLEEIGLFIARHNERRALSFIREIQQHFVIIAINPEVYRLRPDLGERIRVAPFGRYVIVFRTFAEHVLIDRVLSGYRDSAKQLS